MLPVFFLITLLPLLSFAKECNDDTTCSDGQKHYRTTIRHIESGGIGYEDGYTTFEAFFSPDPSSWKITPFFDARGHIFNNGKWAANAGIGVRTLLGSRAYGVNAYYDYRNTGRFDSNQFGIGIETLGEVVDFRINGYLPFGTKKSGPYDTTFKEFSENYMILSQKYQSCMKGADAEFGFHFAPLKSFDFYAAVGPYYFIGNMNSPTWGGKGRISATFNDTITLEISDSYDKTFHNKLQAQIFLNFSFGPKSKVKRDTYSCRTANILNNRMLQPVNRQEIIVVDNTTKNSIAQNPSTGLPYFFVFVNNTSNSAGTYESPYHSLLQAQENSSINDIIYVFPGDGTTNGMDSGIFLKDNQKFWGSGISHSIQTSQGMISIPAQSNRSPIITNTNVDTDGNVVTLAGNNTISGFTITSALNDAIYGINVQNLEVSSCTITDTTTYPIEASFSGTSFISVTNNEFLDNVNGIILTLNGESTVLCSNNNFQRQTSVSSVPIEIISTNNVMSTELRNNTFNQNTTGSIRFNLNNTNDCEITVVNNVITNNDTGAQASLGSSFVILADGTISTCSILLKDNTFSGNTSNSVYLHTSGSMTALEIDGSSNVILNNGGSGFVVGTPVTDTLTFTATANSIRGLNDHAISIYPSGSTADGTITISNNTIIDIRNDAGDSNGITVNRDFSTLSLTVSDNEISRCSGTGISTYSPIGINSLTINISDNTINNCENLSSNASSGIAIQQYTTLSGSITNNLLTENSGVSVAVESSLTTPSVCLTLSGNNSSTGYLLVNPGDGVFNLSPCNVETVNIGTINTSGAITEVCSCPLATPCSD